MSPYNQPHRHQQNTTNNNNRNDRAVPNYPNFKGTWITKGLDNEAVGWIEDFAKRLVEYDPSNNTRRQEYLSTSQFRNIFGEIRSIQQIPEKDNQKKKNRIILLKPKIAYAQKKTKTTGFPKDFKDKLDEALELVINASDEKFNTNFNNFVDFVEALLAYHKAHDKK